MQVGIYAEDIYIDKKKRQLTPESFNNKTLN